MLRKMTIDELTNIVDAEMASHLDRDLTAMSGDLRYRDFSESGLTQAGQKFDFPAQFLTKLSNTGSESLANDIIADRQRNFFKNHKDRRMLLRQFNGSIYGVLSDRYAIFDDNEVLSLLSQSDYLKNSEQMWGYATPERFHARFISQNKLRIPNDTSDLSMATFIDNSMIGQSAFKVRFGIYRWACTNGMISGLKEFTLIKERHIGEKSFYLELQKALADARQYESMLLDMVENASTTHSKIYELSEDDALRYIKEKLVCGKKMAKKVYDNYASYVSVMGDSKWTLTNAITDTAHELNINDRLRFEEVALKVA